MGEDGTGGYGEGHQEEKLRWLDHIWRMAKEEPTRHCFGFLREEREEKDRRKTGRRSVRTTLEAWKYHGRGRRSWRLTELSGEDALTDVQIYTGRTKV